MQPYALTVDKFLDHAAKWFGDREIVTADAGRVAGRIGYAGLRDRANRLFALGSARSGTSTVHRRREGALIAPDGGR